MSDIVAGSDEEVTLGILARAGGTLTAVALEERFYMVLEILGRPYEREFDDWGLMWHIPAQRHAFREKGEQWYTLTITCPHCGREHTHGGGTDNEPSWGHRRAHCTTESDGYFLYPAPGVYKPLAPIDATRE